MAPLPPQVDPASATPLYAQIVGRLEFAIATGRIASGTTLPSLRDAQEQWGVNLHTVRHAYLELARLGLVQIHDRVGAVVLPIDATRPHGGLRELLADCLREAERRFGADPAAVLAELERLMSASRSAPVSVLECSMTLATMIGEQIAELWAVQVIPDVIGSGERLPGPVVSTYFHYREIHAHYEDRVADLAFVRIEPAARLMRLLEASLRSESASRIIICETDASIGHDLAAALRNALPGALPIEVKTPGDIAHFVSEGHPGTLKVVSPRNWDALGDGMRNRPDVFLLEYAVNTSDLRELGAAFGWRERKSAAAREALTVG